ncbi:unnamed protein product [Microthlaspi erraticum]|uniref:Uncharacterized protein n=1 Tax=Microthlaspi erraticum TaxID=1685480 RepID=A0A6D2IZ54_9BRAS|nr:unnamed protein product [Microthlaspi erraticum]
MSGEVHIPYILLEIPSNFRCVIFIPNMPSRDDGSLAIDFDIFRLGSPAPISSLVDDWTNYGSDQGSNTMLSMFLFLLMVDDVRSNAFGSMSLLSCFLALLAL